LPWCGRCSAGTIRSGLRASCAPPSEGDVRRGHLAIRLPALSPGGAARAPGARAGDRRLLDPAEDPWLEEEIHECRIELRAAAGAYPLGRVRGAAAPLVGAALRDGVEGIGDADDAHLERDLGAA
jgi:hypothetical protein